MIANELQYFKDVFKQWVVADEVLEQLNDIMYEYGDTGHITKDDVLEWLTKEDLTCDLKLAWMAFNAGILAEAIREGVIDDM